MPKNPKVAIVYDRVNKFGGAERVLLALRKIYPQSVLFTSVFEPSAATWVDDWEVRTSFLQQIPFARRHHEWLAPLMPLAFESLDLSGFDIVISVTSEFAKNILTNPEQLHVCYCLTPTRYLWSHTREYGGGHFASLKRIMFSWLRLLDLASASRPTQFIAISRRVQKRITHYYHRDSDLVYPPTSLVVGKTKAKKGPKYYLVVSRLVPYKRVDLAIAACIRLKRHLRVVGTGSDGLRLLELVAGNPYIHFEGSINDDKLRQLYAGASALICPQEEDFGLVSVEAQCHGVPVVSYAKSGVAETVLDGKTGILFTEPAIGSLIRALKACEAKKWQPTMIRRQAEKFSETRFKREFGRKVLSLWKKLEA